jgi:M6 family metalloprotease-like protein
MKSIPRRGFVGFIFFALLSIASFAFFRHPTFIKDNSSPVLAQTTGQTVTFDPIEDAYVFSKYPDANFGKSIILFASLFSDSSTRISFIKFDLTSLSGKMITSAKLQMSLGVSSYSYTKKFIAVDPDLWSENTLTYKNKPALSGPVLAEKAINGSSREVVEVNLDANLVSKYAGKKFSVAIDNVSQSPTTLAIFSREYASFKPRLVVSYTDLPKQSNTIEGVFSITVLEDFDGKKSTEVYEVQTQDRKTYRINYTGKDLPKPGSKVRIDLPVSDPRLTSAPNQILPTSKTITTNSMYVVEQPTATGSSVGNRNTFVLLLNYSSGPPPITDITKSAVQTFFSSTFYQFFSENSYQKLNISSDVNGWVTHTLPDCSTETHTSILENAIQAIDLYFDVDLGNYTDLMIVSPKPCPAEYKGWATNGPRLIFTEFGLRYIPVSWIDASFLYDMQNSFLHASAHEFGHNIGASHANSYYCGRVAFSDPSHCESLLTGDYWDMMGANYARMHFNGYRKYQLGWLDPGRYLTITSDGDYSIGPLETPEGTSPKLAVINVEPDLNIYIENRNPIGFDTGIDPYILDGAYVYVGPRSLNSGDTHVIDTTPGSIETDSNGNPTNFIDFKDAALRLGETFVDQVHGISIQLLSNNPLGDIKIRVKFNYFDNKCYFPLLGF